jgi:hypothetical protein
LCVVALAGSPGCDAFLRLERVTYHPDAPAIDAVDAFQPDAPWDAANLTCPNGYVLDAITHSHYRVAPGGYDFRTAAGFCAGDELTGTFTGHTHLAVVSDLTEREILGAYNGSWIGLTDLDTGVNNWVWVSKEPRPFDPSPTDNDLWDTGEPNQPGIEDCGIFNQGDFHVNNTACTDLRSYVCECDVWENDPTRYQ